MKPRTWMWMPVVSLVAALAITIPISAQTIISFDAPGAGTGPGQGTYVSSMNPSGAITGVTRDAADKRHGFVRSPNGTFTTFDVPGSGRVAFQGTRTLSINPSGAVTGWYLDLSWSRHGYVRDEKGNFTSFDAPGASKSDGTWPESINPAGAIAGFSIDAKNSVFHGFLRSAHPSAWGSIITIDAPGAGTSAYVGTLIFGINPAGAVAGEAHDNNNVAHGFLRGPDGTFTTFDAPGAGTDPNEGTLVYGINPAGAITGSTIDSSFVFHGYVRAPDGTFTTFDAPGAGTVSYSGQGTTDSSINPAGAIVGNALDASNVYHGFLRDPNGNFTTFDAPGAGNATDSYLGTFPMANNPSGKITGSYTDAGNVLHGFVREP